MVEWEIDLRNAGIQLVRQRTEWADLGVAPDLDTTVGMTTFMRGHFDRENKEIDRLSAMFGLSGRLKTEAEFMGTMDAMIQKCERVPIFEQTFREWPRG